MLRVPVVPIPTKYIAIVQFFGVVFVVLGSRIRPHLNIFSLPINNKSHLFAVPSKYSLLSVKFEHGAEPLLTTLYQMNTNSSIVRTKVHTILYYEKNLNIFKYVDSSTSD